MSPVWHAPATWPRPVAGAFVFTALPNARLVAMARYSGGWRSSGSLAIFAAIRRGRLTQIKNGPLFGRPKEAAPPGTTVH